jgi:hypothetical protein
VSEGGVHSVRSSKYLLLMIQCAGRKRCLLTEDAMHDTSGLAIKTLSGAQTYVENHSQPRLKPPHPLH